MKPDLVGEVASQMPADLGREPWHATTFEQDEDAGNGSGLTLVGRRLLAENLNRHTGIEIELIQQEVVWMDRGDIERFERRLGEVDKIESDDNFGIRPDRGGQDVPILRVVGHPADERLVTCYGRIRERSAHLGDPPIDSVGSETRSIKLRRSSSKTSADHNGRYASASASPSSVSQREAG
jgi:hypothetical protein